MSNFEPKPVNNLTEWAELIRSIPDKGERGFDMDSPWFKAPYSRHGCATVACIGGWLLHVNGLTNGADYELEIMRIAPHVVETEATKLCYDYPTSARVTKKQAARAIEILRDTGKCDWKRAVKEGKV